MEDLPAGPPIHCGLRRKRWECLAGVGRGLQGGWPTALWDLGYMGAGLFSLRDAVQGHLAKQLVVE